MLDANREDLVLGIVGAGLMGRGIAQIAALAGIEVLMFDLRAGAAEEAKAALEQTLSMLVDKGKLSADERAAAAGRIVPAAALGEFARCHVVVEAIIENLDAKRDLFRQLEGVVGDDCLLASNTSSLAVTSIAAACRLPERVAGFHFFSPVPLMKIVEVIEGVLSAPWVGETLTALARRMGHTPVRAKDTPGFIVNHAGRGFLTEALRIVGEGVADFATVDRVLRAAAGFRLGPFELLDLTGLDVSHPVMESIYNQYYQEPRYRPSPIARQRLAAGLLGRKSGRGFYVHADGKPQTPPAPAAPALRD
ncbi:MAG: 3-hydroxyacyl-CoA dehydrogenase, partial [Thauera phenolivorans]|nr:3-hydroxyacyl-CoA dehydrogenase [Thauera phenolivorans]